MTAVSKRIEDIEEIKLRYRSTKPARHFDDGQYGFLYNSYSELDDGDEKDEYRSKCLIYCIGEFKLLLRDIESRNNNVFRYIRTGQWDDFESDVVYWKKNIDRVCTRMSLLYPGINVIKVIQEVESES